MRTKKKAGRKRVMALLCAALITANLPIGTSAVYAADAADTPGRTAYADKKGLQENYDLSKDTEESKKSVQRVYFGKDGNGNPQKWKIAGEDKEIDGDNIVLFAESAIKTPNGKVDGTIQFWPDSSSATKPYPTEETERAALGITYVNGKTPATVNVNHYGTSTLRSELRSMAKDARYFTTAQQALMNPTTITTEDTYTDSTTSVKNGNYTTTDILYAAYGDSTSTDGIDQYIHVGTNRGSGDLNNGLKIDRLINIDGGYVNIWEKDNKYFWLRAPVPHYANAALAARPGSSVSAYHVPYPYAVVPAFDLNLTSVIFASAAAPAASSQEKEAVEITETDDAMIFRWADRQNKIKSKATWNEDGIKLTQKDDGDNVYLCVQGKNGEKDWIWSKKVTEVADTNPITADTIASALKTDLRFAETTAVDLSKCKIWLETTDATDGLTYAKQARKLAKPAASTQFATVEQLKTFDTNNSTNDTNGVPNHAKVYFGKDKQQWWIAGSQDTDSLVLFAASPLATGIRFNDDTNSKNYDESWGCEYTGGSTITTVNANHYGGSDIRNGNQSTNNPGLKGLLESHFTDGERSRMNETTVYTQDTANVDSGQPLKYSTTDKLYLAYSAGNGSSYQHIMVGANSADHLDSGLRVDKNYWGDNDAFWLRAPRNANGSIALPALPGSYVGHDGVTSPLAAVPAFNFNLTSVLFGSAAPAATGEGGQLDTKDVTKEGAFTLRYKSDSIGTATLSKAKQSVSISEVSEGSEVDTYLVAQNSEGAWAKKVSNGDVIFADEMYSDLVSFENCKVWLETTDSDARITSAAMAKQSEEDTYTVKIKAGQNMTLTGDSVQTVNVNGKIKEVTATAGDKYHISLKYSPEVIDGISVARDEKDPHGKLNVSGEPVDDVLIVLPKVEKHTSEKAENKPSYFKQAVCDMCDKEYGTLSDDNSPTGSVKIGNGASNTSFLNNISFSYYNEQQTVEITVADDSTGAAGYDAALHAPKAYYYIASEKMSSDDVKKIKDGDWKLYTEKFTLKEDSKNIVYVKLVDWSKNTSYISSNGVVVDTTAPDISGAEDGKTYCSAVEVTVSDEYLDSVKLDEEEVTLTNGKFTVSPEEGTQTIVAADKAGNTKTITITVNKDHDWNEASYSWSEDGKACTAERICKNDDRHKETARAKVTSEVIKKPSCTGKGEAVYTAAFTEAWAQSEPAQTKTIADIPATGHHYVDGKCTVCGDTDKSFGPSIKGEANGGKADGKQKKGDTASGGEAVGVQTGDESAPALWTGLMLAALAAAGAAIYGRRKRQNQT